MNLQIEEINFQIQFLNGRRNGAQPKLWNIFQPFMQQNDYIERALF